MAKQELQQFVTGIRVIDVFAPIVLGSVCRLQWRASTGATILMAELIRRFVQSGGRRVVCMGCLPNSEQLREWRADMEEYELDQYIADFCVDTDSTECNEQLEKALNHTRELLMAEEDVLIVLLQPDGRDDWSERARSLFSDLNASRHFVILVLTNYGDGQAKIDKGICTTRIVLDPARARAGLYPPIDPLASTCSADIGGKLNTRRLSVVKKARARFTAYAEHDPDLQHLAKRQASRDGSGTTHHSMPLFECCAQALYVATAYTGIDGVSQSLNNSIVAFEKVIGN